MQATCGNLASESPRSATAMHTRHDGCYRGTCPAQAWHPPLNGGEIFEYLRRSFRTRELDFRQLRQATTLYTAKREGIGREPGGIFG